MKIKILKKHFDRAVKQPWSGPTCILAQAAEDYDGVSIFDIAGGSLAAKKALLVFDRHFFDPGDERHAKLKKLRASLPIVIDLP